MEHPRGLLHGRLGIPTLGPTHPSESHDFRRFWSCLDFLKQRHHLSFCGGETGQMVFLQAISARWRCPRPKEWVELHQCKSTVWRGWTQCRLLPTQKNHPNRKKNTVDDVSRIQVFHACWRLETISCSLHVSQCRMSNNNYPVLLLFLWEEILCAYHFWRGSIHPSGAGFLLSTTSHETCVRNELHVFWGQRLFFSKICPEKIDHFPLNDV